MVLSILLRFSLLFTATLTILSANVDQHNAHDRHGHFKDGKHNDDYDHEAFVGRDKAPDYDQLSPDDSQHRLIQLVSTKIDTDNDGYVSQLELRDHIDHIQKRNMRSNVNDAWTNFDAVHIRDDQIHWDNYVIAVFGADFDLNKVDPKHIDDYRKAFKRDKNRFDAADVNRNGALDSKEYECFMRPEFCDSMRDEIVEETLDEMDRNQDGFVDLKEYMDDISEKNDMQHDQEQAEWIEQERQLFHTNWDRNSDGKLDRAELADWMMPVGVDYAYNEATHLITTADDDKDGQLSIDEFLNHYETFVGSQATDYGEELKKRHDPTEL